MSRHFHKTLVQAQVMTDRILPALPILPVIREVGHDILVDAIQREPFLGTVSYCHHDEGVVAVSWFLVLLIFFLVVFRFGAIDGLCSSHVQL